MEVRAFSNELKSQKRFDFSKKTRFFRFALDSWPLGRLAAFVKVFATVIAIIYECGGPTSIARMLRPPARLYKTVITLGCERGSEFTDDVHKRTAIVEC